MANVITIELSEHDAVRLLLLVESQRDAAPINSFAVYWQRIVRQIHQSIETDRSARLRGDRPVF